MLETRHHWLPIILTVYLPLSFVITYSIAVGNKHVEPGFPYISDTGTRSPESCVFGQLLNIGAVLAGIIIYTRYRQSLYHFENSARKYLLHLNTAAFITGLLTIFGVSLVGNFQETNILVVHLLGAFLAFAVGFVYMILQTIISCKSVSFKIPGNSLFIRRLRIALCVADLVLLILLSIMTLVAGSKGPGEGIEVYDWTASHPGYAEHLVATISEWLVAFITVIYFATFYKEFKQFRMKPPEVIYYNEQPRTEIAGSANETTRISTGHSMYYTTGLTG
ncbi:DNA damage-regulated autophagy modulator protein 2-like isoform X1 [Mercenaria mercenaria]|uniref:DNA damage-regulated autophagy modulator protein 2-like isoform X1 n=1 Tax=Mercenaria mercenaria TaxID=6596 RepID=UPI00234F85AE|nr:DNA damage-regulated autophagy modulator protein 2-like isoform X1 [Mercenaria mercenaria]XP_045175781.2 DNA damage-regulated autophagy modulator protein 2-like isoform X1 [Mercenaria mercenaria]XP_045175782.2 DNA damage-regulated autophagy modulator protein 2-like isoform X1 [Mercenaria mercenaria]XP_045175783.2 DNA damage-regulated autophagy modulator protein 2-like isoform X1 [Mercenaria mercenaria]XP_045175784.2 DNA damage-regulated autophagy modulator protein 2-like isoform X1 [Mercenar